MSFRSPLLLGFVSRSAVHAAECTAGEIAEARVLISQPVSSECDVLPVSEFSSFALKAFCAKEGCYKEYQEFAKTLPDCESRGQDLKESFSEKLASEFQEVCPESNEEKGKDTSDAHGWSAVYYMLATVLPMALLWV